MSDKKEWIIYSLNIDDEIIYIGSTTQKLKTRLSQHRFKKNLGTECEIRKICSANSQKEAENKEEHLINLIGIHRLMNKVASQRKGFLGCHHTEEARNKIRIKQTGRSVNWAKPWTQERREKSIIALTGVKKRPGSKNETFKKWGVREFDIYRHGIFIGRFINQTEAARAVDLPKSTFVNILKGIRIKTKGIEVRYV